MGPFFFINSPKGTIQKNFMTRHYVEQVWLVCDYFSKKIDLCDVSPPLEDLPMEENDYVTI